MDNTQEVFSRLVGRVLGALDLAHVDDNLKQTVKAYIWQAKKDLQENCKNKGVDNEAKKM